MVHTADSATWAKMRHHGPNEGGSGDPRLRWIYPNLFTHRVCLVAAVTIIHLDGRPHTNETDLTGPHTSVETRNSMNHRHNRAWSLVQASGTVFLSIQPLVLGGANELATSTPPTRSGLLAFYRTQTCPPPGSPQHNHYYQPYRAPLRRSF